MIINVAMLHKISQNITLLVIMIKFCYVHLIVNCELDLRFVINIVFDKQCKNDVSFGILYSVNQ